VVCLALCSPVRAQTHHISPCAEGQALESLGRLDAAQSVYLLELGHPASRGCARQGLDRLGRLDESCAYANALKDVGERQSAHSAYLKVLAVDPSSRCALAGAKATLPGSTGTIWTWLSAAAKNAGYALGAVVLALLALAGVILGWLQLQTRTKWLGLRDRWPATNIRRPTLEIAKFDDSALSARLGPGTSGLVRGRVTWKTDRFGLNLVSGQAGIASALSGLGDISDEAKAAVAVINFLTALLPRRRFALCGELQPAGAEGVGISLELSRGGGAEALITFWAAPFLLGAAEPAEAFQHLAVAAGAWVDIWMAKAVQGDDLLTGDPQSWAFFRSGVDWQRLGYNDKARSLYEQALAKDGENVGALANLGILCRRAGDYEQAREYLTRALRPLGNANLPPKLAPEENPDWYRVEYQFAALYANWSSEPSEGAAKAENFATAAKEARNLARVTLSTLTELSSGAHKSKAPPEFLTGTLQPFLEGTIAPPVLVLVASTAAADLQPLPDGGLPVRPTEQDLLAALEPPSDPEAPLPALQPWPFVAFVERGTNRPPAALFNLACFYTRTGDLSSAAQRLQSAVRETPPSERKSLIAVIEHDPTLAPLRAKRPGVIPKLQKILTPAPDLDEAATASLAEFELQNRVRARLGSEGWAVHWEELSSRFTFSASNDDGEWLLVQIAGTTPLAEDDIYTTLGLLTKFHQDNPARLSARALVIVPHDGVLDGVDVADAKHRGVEIEQEAQPN